VVAVLLYHGGVGWLSGGFLGVDAFFVLSGYLVTTLLLTDDLRPFWARRARRLLPAFAPLVVVVLLLGATGLLNASPRDALGAVTYLGNWRSIVTGGGYFASFTSPSAFRHTWSLAVEGQFYVVWPLLVILVCRRSRGAVLATAGAGALVSAWAMRASYTPYGDPSRAYYGTDTRIQALFVGAALAIVLAARGASVRRPVMVASGIGGAALTVWLWHAASGSSPALYRGGFLVAAVASAAVVASVVTLPESRLAQALSVRPLRALGRVSYGVYLWHWPVYLLLTHERVHAGGVVLLALRLAVTGGLAAASWTYVEVPGRTWRPRLRTVALGRVSVAAMAVVVAVFGVSSGWHPATATRGTNAAAAEPATRAPRPPVAAPRPRPRRTPRPSSSPTAAVASRSGTRRVLFLGDSVAETLAAGLRDGDGIDVVNGGILGCGIATGGPYRYFGGQYDDLPQCARWPITWADAVRRADPALVAVLVGRWDVMDRKHDGRWMHVGDAAYDAYLGAQLDRLVTILAGRRVAFLTAPYYKRGERPDGGRFPEDDPARVDRFNAIVRSVAARHPGVEVIDLNAALAPEGVFTKTINGVLVRYDGVHVSPAGARLIQPWLWRQISAVLGRGSP
jgi:peptidoglycan/LPS O-acetylase OafA/YrhL/lysophospholipase L1-like esterase